MGVLTMSWMLDAVKRLPGTVPLSTPYWKMMSRI